MNSRTKIKYLLSFGHFCSDVNQGALAATLPFLIAARNYDYATAASLVMISNLIGSMIQPLFGQLADKKNLPQLIAVGLFFAGGGMALTGFAENFYFLSVAVMISGVGIAMFHPQAMQLVHKISTENDKGQSVSIFSFGGNLGFCFGPILTTFAIYFFGLKGTLIFILPEIIIFILFKNFFAEIYKFNQPQTKKISEKNSSEKDNWRGFFLLTAVVIGRSIIFHGFNTFLAIYFIRELGQTEAIGNTILSVYYAISAACVLIGGKISDIFGYRKIIRLSFLILLPTIIFFAFAENIFFAVILVLPLGASISFSYSPMVVLGQKYLPNRVGLASGVTLGLAVSIGGIFAPILGIIADNFGLIFVIYALGIISIVPLIFSLILPEK